MKGLRRFTGKGLIAVTTIFFLTIFSGCVTKEARKDLTEEEILRQRIMAYWEFKIRQAFDKSYDFEDPLFRKKMTLVNYIKGFNTARAGWSGASIEGLKIEGDSAIVDMKVKVRIFASPSKPIEQDVALKEKWVKVDGLWYHVPQKFKERQSAN